MDDHLLKAKSLAICSGKGGVGKTITAANLSIFYARQGLRVGLIDLDPLSDIAALLDVREAESILQPGSAAGPGTLDDFVMPLFPRLDLLFPAPKLAREERQNLHGKIFEEFPQALNDRYDILVFDLPAGSDFGENLSFLPYMRLLLLVTNPEPTAHAAAGAYVRRALELYPELTVHVWHNRYSGDGSNGFDPRDLVGNYNRNVPEEERLGPGEAARLRDFCFVPEDPSLNLLRGEPDAVLNLLHRMMEVLMLIHAERVAAASRGLEFGGKSLDLVRYFVNHHRDIGPADAYLEDLGRFLGDLLHRNLSRLGRENPLGPHGPVFSEQERDRLREFLEAARGDAVRAPAARLIDLLDERIEALKDAHRPFQARAAAATDKAVDREIGRFLLVLNALPAREKETRDLGALLLFYFSLYKLFQSPSIARLLEAFVPKKKDRQGRPVRDRRAQIHRLMDPNGRHRQEFLRLIRTLYPILTRQMANIARVFRLDGLLFRDRHNAVLRKAYLSLLTHFTHDTLYSGLSVVVGFAYRPASRAFQQGAEKALQLLHQPVLHQPVEEAALAAE